MVGTKLMEIRRLAALGHRITNHRRAAVLETRRVKKRGPKRHSAKGLVKT